MRCPRTPIRTILNRTLALPLLVEAEESAEVELAPADVVLLARLRTDDVVIKDEPLALVCGVNREFVAAAAPEPAPEEEPAVLDATVATVPVVEPWM